MKGLLKYLVIAVVTILFIHIVHANDLPISQPILRAEVVNDPPPPDEDDNPTIYDEEIVTRNDSIIYVLDISGSMNGDRRSYTGLDGSTAYGTRLDRAKTEVAKSITSLTQNFYFNIIAYDCDVRKWSASKQKADPGPKASAIGWTMGLTAVGATGTGPAVVNALGDKENFTVVLLSDGSPNCGATGIAGHLRMIQTANTQRAAIHCFGISCYGDFERFMRDIAITNGGRYIPVP